MTDVIELAGLTVAGVRQGLAEGRFSCEALTAACLARIARYNPIYNAVIFVNPEALADARAIDARIATGEALGSLAGVPVVIKDPMDMVGFPTTGGWSQLYSGAGGVDLMPGSDSAVVARMRAAGAILLGKTNVPVLSASGTHANNSWAGPTVNAAAPDFAPGASSAGTASAVAAGMAVLGLAEETGGSIQNPAGAQALVGIKPTHGLVPNTGVLPLSSQRDVVGPIARCVADAALCLDVLAGFTMADPKTVAAVGRLPVGGYAAGLSTTALAGRRVGLYGPGWRTAERGGALAEETAGLYAQAQADIAARGAVLVEDPFAGSGFADISVAGVGGMTYDRRGMESLPYDMQKYLERLGPDAALRSFAAFAAATQAQDPFAPGGVLQYMAEMPAFQASLADPAAVPELREFVAAREAYLAVFDAVMERHGLDVLAFPQQRAPLPALHGEAQIRTTTVSEINIAGLPGVVVPAGYHADGSPFALIWLGRRFSEATLLALAYDYEQATQHRRVPVLRVA